MEQEMMRVYLVRLFQLLFCRLNLFIEMAGVAKYFLVPSE